MVWNDPPGLNVQVRAAVIAGQNANAYLKGGAYRTTDPAEFAYADLAKIDGNLLYRRAFDQGRFSFPLGTLAAGQHTLEFTLTKSGSGATQFWFGVNDQSFDSIGGK